MKRLIAYLLSQYIKHPWSTLFLTLLMLFTLTFQVLFSFSFKFLIDDVLVPKKIDLLSILLICLLIGAVLSSLSEILKDYLLIKTGVKVKNKLHLSVFSHLQLLPENYYRKTSSSKIQSKLSSDVGNIHTSFINFQSILFSVLGLIVSASLLFTLDWVFSILTILGIPLCFLLPRLMNKKVSDSNERYKEKDNLNDLALERLSAHEMFRTFRLKDWEYNRMKTTVDGLTPLAVKAQFMRRLMQRSVTITLLLLNVLLISLGAYLSIAGEITVGVLVAFQSFFIVMSQYVAKLTDYIPQLVDSKYSMQQIDKLFAEKPSKEEQQGIDVLPTSLNRGIIVKDVSFSYTPEQEILKDINMSIPLHTHCAVVGSSGSGKTSIVNLILRLFQPSKGEILFDTININQISSQSYRDLTGFVPQNIVLLNISLKENIRLGKPEATDLEVEAAAKAIGIHEWISSLPNGYHTLAGEGGRYLSGGQKQLIAIARVLIRNSSILVLDEATSSLDPSTEQMINSTMRNLVKQNTVLSVTHRLQNVVEADRIFVMNKGQLVDYGSHEQLIARCEVYEKMWNKQSGFQINEDGTEAGITIDRLRQIPLFNELEEEILIEIKDYLASEKFSPEENVIEQGSIGDKFYIVVRGRVEVLIQKDLGGQKSLAILDDGDYFGEMALLKKIPRTATVKTLTPSTFLTMKRSQFQKIISKSNQLKERLENEYEKRLAAQK
jgi:ATP-binding cassette, subfamily B, bacterial